MTSKRFNIVLAAIVCLFYIQVVPSNAGIISSILKAGKSAKLAKGGLAAGGLGGAVKLFKTPDSNVLAITSHADGLKFTDELGKSIDIPNGRLSSDLLNSQFATGKFDEIFLDLDTLAKHPNLTKGLNKKVKTKVVINDKAYNIRPNATGADLMVTDKVAVALPKNTDGFKTSIKNSLHYLNRSINKANVRPLRFDNGAKVNSVKKIGTRTNGVPDIDAINPATLDTSLSYLRGQQAIVSGKVVGDALRVNAGGKVTNIPLSQLRKAAAKNKIQLTILDTPTPKQPGSRGLFGKKKMQGLETALSARTNGDFLDALAPKNGPPLSITEIQSDSYRAEFIIQSGAKATKQTKTVNSVAENLPTLAHIPVNSILNFTSSREYDDEQDRRLIPWLPFWWHIYLVMSFILGFYGLEIAANVFNPIWPVSDRWQHNPRKYISFPLFCLKLATFFLIWLPLTGLIWFFARIAMAIYWLLSTIVRIALTPFKWIFR